MSDIDRLSHLCQKRRIFLVVDAVQAIGVRAIDLEKTPVDMLMCGGQKYLGAIMGIGFIYVNNRIMPHLRDTKVGIRSMKCFTEDSYELKEAAARFEDGTQNLLGIVALHAAIKHINNVGIIAIEKKNLALLKKFKSMLREAHIPFIDHPQQSNILSLNVEDPIGLCTYLSRKNIIIKPIKDVARISFTYTSRIVDFQMVVKHIEKWLKKYPAKGSLVY